MEEKIPTKHELLDRLEEQVILIAGELAIRKIGYTPRYDMMEESLGEIIKAVLALKKREGIPSNLKLVEE